jgi:hypothetical protein
MATNVITLVRSDMGDGGWSLHGRRADIDDGKDPDGAWPILLSGESETDAEGEWLRPNAADLTEARERLLALRRDLVPMV